MAATRNPHIRLLHIRDEIEGLSAALKGVNFEAYRGIIGIGNILRHEYQHLDDRRLWDIVTVHLPQLQGVIMRMLAELEHDR